MVAKSPVTTDSRDGEMLRSECQRMGKEEEKAGPGLLILYRRKQGSWGTTGFEAFEQGGHGRRLRSGGQTQAL